MGIVKSPSSVHIKEVNMKIAYPVIFTDAKDAILVEVPDLKIYTESNGMEDKKSSMAEAMAMAREAIGINCISREDEGKELITPSSLVDIDPGSGEFASEGKSIVSLVDVDISACRRKLDNKSVRRNVTLPSWLNWEANEAHINVSEVLQDALMTKLGVGR